MQAAAGALTLRLIAIALAVRNAEFLALRAEFRSGGIFAADVLRRGTRTAALARSLRGRGVLFSNSLSCAGALILLVYPDVPGRSALVVLLLGLHILVGLRARHSLDGSDQLLTILLVCMATYCLHPAGIVGMLALLAIAGQALLAYAVSGVAKLLSPKWRKGSAVGEIMSTMAYGDYRTRNIMQGTPWISRLLSWAVMSVEVSLPLAIVAPHGVMYGLLTVGLLFHVGVAVGMRLNRFLPVFVASYPSIIFINSRIRG